MAKAIGAGTAFALTILATGYIGYRIGQTANQAPAGLIIGLITGLIIGLRSILKTFSPEKE